MTRMSKDSSVDSLLNEVFSSNEPVSILGFGSLLSQTSSKSTFPSLQNFRLIKVEGFRRVFQHPAFIFFERGIAQGNRISSLSTEPAEGCSYVAVAFEISGESKESWLKREEEFAFTLAPYTGSNGDVGVGLVCTGTTDDVYIQRWGREKYDQQLSLYNLPGIWGDDINKQILPCSVYLRHCVLGAKSLGDECYTSFLDDTYLVDRRTTIREYLEANPEVMDTLPPESLVGRYSG